MYYLQHERPCCISIHKLEPKARVVYLIQHGRERSKWLVKLFNIVDLRGRESQSYKARKSKLKFMKINRILNRGIQTPSRS